MSALLNVPAELRELPRWLLWRLVDRGGKSTKVPFTASGRPASSTDPATWTTFDVVAAALEGGGFSGVGFVLGDGFVGVDLDKVRDPATGELEPWALEVVQDLDSYAEVSPSGRGVHVIARGSLPAWGRRKGQFEVYDSARYFTVTGQVIEGFDRPPESRELELAALHARIFGAEPPARPTDQAGGPTPSPAPLSMDDEEILRLAFRAANGSRVQQLFGGDVSAYGGDRSRADMALVSMLAFYTDDSGQLDRIFCRSALYRAKWHRKVRADGTTYGAQTINRALSCREHYNPNRRREAPLDNFAQALGRAFAAGPLPEARAAAAEWVEGLGIAPAIVESALARAAGEATVEPEAPEAPQARATGLRALQELLGGATCVELRQALARDGVMFARKKAWTDSERRFEKACSDAMPRSHPGKAALRDGARCGTFSMPYECDAHGPQGVRTNCNERELTCPHCLEARLAGRLEILRETLKAERYAYLIVPVDLADPDRMRAIRRARAAAKAVHGFGDRRWVVGHEHAMLLLTANELQVTRNRIARFVAQEAPMRGVKAARHEAKAFRAVKEFGLTPECIQECSKAELLDVFARVWRSPGVALQALVEASDQTGVLSFPWLQQRNFVRTSADKSGRVTFPWPTNDEIRARAKVKAIAARGGIDPTVCDAACGHDEFGSPIPCLQPYRVYVDHLPTGVRLREEPYVGRFPRKHELDLLLSTADPHALRSGYEQQRALARRR